MSEKLASNHIIKIGIVCEDVEATAKRYQEIFETQAPEPSAAPAPSTCERYKEYKGVRYDNVPLKVTNIYVKPIWFELIQPADDTPSPWKDHLDKYGTSVCFTSVYIEGFEQQIDLMADKGYPVLFQEEKGFERYAYFDTMEKLGLLLEIKERIPR